MLIAAGLDQGRNHALHDVDRNGKTNPGTACHRGADEEVDADDLAAFVEQWAARIARIDRCIGLNGERNTVARLRLDAATQCTDDARSHAVVITKRIADGDRTLPYCNFIQPAAFDWENLHERRIDSDHGQVAVRVRTDQLGRHLHAVREGHRKRIRTINHMMVCHNVAVVIPDPPGTLAHR